PFFASGGDLNKVPKGLRRWRKIELAQGQGAARKASLGLRARGSPAWLDQIRSSQYCSWFSAKNSKHLRNSAETATPRRQLSGNNLGGPNEQRSARPRVKRCRHRHQMS